MTQKHPIGYYRVRFHQDGVDSILHWNGADWLATGVELPQCTDSFAIKGQVTLDEGTKDDDTTAAETVALFAALGQYIDVKIDEARGISTNSVRVTVNRADSHQRRDDLIKALETFRRS